MRSSVGVNDHLDGVFGFLEMRTCQEQRHIRISFLRSSGFVNPVFESTFPAILQHVSILVIVEAFNLLSGLLHGCESKRKTFFFFNQHGFCSLEGDLVCCEDDGSDCFVIFWKGCKEGVQVVFI